MSNRIDAWITRYVPLAKFAAKRLTTGKDAIRGKEDLFQEGLIAIWKAAQKYPDKPDEEMHKIIKTSIFNRLKTIVLASWQANHQANTYTIDLDACDLDSILTHEGFMANVYFKESLAELKAMLTPLARDTVELYHKPTTELIRIVKADLKQKQQRFDIRCAKILKKHLACLFGISEVEMSSIMKEIRLTLELYPVFAS